MSSVVRGVGLVGLLALTGCFQYSEDVWIYEDHSGRVEVQVRVPTATWERALNSGLLEPGDVEGECRRVARQVGGVDLADFKEISTSEYHRISWTFAFANPVALQTLLTVMPDGVTRLFPVEDTGVRYVLPEAEVNRLGRLTTFYRRIPPMRYPPDAFSALAGADDYEVRFRVYTPEPVLSAPDVTTTGDGRTAVWETSLQELVQDGVEVRISFRQAFPVAPVVLSLAGLVCAIGGMYGFAYRHMSRGLRELPAEPSGGGSKRDAWGGESFTDSGEDAELSFPPED